MTSSRRRKRRNQDDDDDEGVSETLNNSYRRFRAELYAWEDERRDNRPEPQERKAKPKIKRKRPKIERKPKTNPKDDDSPRSAPE